MGEGVGWETEGGGRGHPGNYEGGELNLLKGTFSGMKLTHCLTSVLQISASERPKYACWMTVVGRVVIQKS